MRALLVAYRCTLTKPELSHTTGPEPSPWLEPANVSLLFINAAKLLDHAKELLFAACDEAA